MQIWQDYILSTKGTNANGTIIILGHKLGKSISLYIYHNGLILGTGPTGMTLLGLTCDEAIIKALICLKLVVDLNASFFQ